MFDRVFVFKTQPQNHSLVLESVFDFVACPDKDRLRRKTLGQLPSRLVLHNCARSYSVNGKQHNDPRSNAALQIVIASPLQTRWETRPP